MLPLSVLSAVYSTFLSTAGKPLSQAGITLWLQGKCVAAGCAEP